MCYKEVIALRGIGFLSSSSLISLSLLCTFIILKECPKNLCHLVNISLFVTMASSQLSIILNCQSSPPLLPSLHLLSGMIASLPYVRALSVTSGPSRMLCIKSIEDELFITFIKVPLKRFYMYVFFG